MQFDVAVQLLHMLEREGGDAILQDLTDVGGSPIAGELLPTVTDVGTEITPTANEAGEGLGVNVSLGGAANNQRPRPGASPRSWSRRGGVSPPHRKSLLQACIAVSPLFLMVTHDCEGTGPRLRSRPGWISARPANRHGSFEDGRP